jgi:hypothetical protein
MILRAGDRVPQPVQAGFPEAGREAGALLAAKGPEHELRGGPGAGAGDQAEDQAGQKSVPEDLDRFAGGGVLGVDSGHGPCPS